MVEPRRRPVDVFRRRRIDPWRSVVELRPSSARLRRTDGRFGVPSVVLRPVGTNIEINHLFTTVHYSLPGGGRAPLSRGASGISS